MPTRLTRRSFAQGAMAIGASTSLGDFGFLNALPSIQPNERKIKPEAVQFDDDVEPLIRIIEETPREKLIERMVGKVHEGVSYQRLLSSVFLAGIRNIQPRPVGFEFHCVLAIHAAHQAALAAPDGDRWLALFWALDIFKQSQAVKQKKGAWTMPRLDQAKLPALSGARNSFTEAMDQWDPEGADRSIAVLARSTGANELLELFARYGARDFRDIGHKSIYVANAFRTLNTIGWRHAEPVLRSVTFALLDSDGRNPAKEDLEPDRPWRENVLRAKKIRTGWQSGTLSSEATREILQLQRNGSVGDVSDQVVALLNNKIDPRSIWDGFFLAAGELLMRKRGIVALHAMTSLNALHWAYQTSINDETRRMLMLQAAAYVSLFRRALGKEAREGVAIDALELGDITGADPVEDIFATVTSDRMSASRKTLAFLQQNASNATAMMAAVRRLVFNKGRDSHDYKFSSAMMEDYYHISPPWRDRYLASGLFWLHGSKDQDNELIQRTRASLAGRKPS